jgi:hypothetical protein
MHINLGGWTFFTLDASGESVARWFDYRGKKE